MKLYQSIATKLAAIENCRASNNVEWLQRWKDALTDIMRERMPSGSGIDCGTKLHEASTPDCLRLVVEFHHMDACGGYCGWTSHVITVRPSLAHGFTLAVSGRDRNGIKDYLCDVYNVALNEEA